VGFCRGAALPNLKLASRDVNDWVLLERIAKTAQAGDLSTAGRS